MTQPGKAPELSQEEQEKRRLVSLWIQEIKLAQKHYEEYTQRAKKLIKRFRDEKQDSQYSTRGNKFQLFWSNVSTLQPSLYARTPKPQVERRFKTADPVGRDAATILERATDYSVQHCQDFDAVMKACRDDYLIVARGTAWERYVPHFSQQPQQMRLQISNEPNPDKQPVYLNEKGEPVDVKPEQVKQDAQGLYIDQPVEVLAYEESVTDYVHWSDFLHSPARVWEEVRWVARRCFLSKAEVVKRFGEEFKSLPCTHLPEHVKDNTKESSVQEPFRQAEVWEIWDKISRKVYWVCTDYSNRFLDEREDPLGLSGFFPCPKPLFATLTTDSLIPVPDFCQYQDQADMLDEVTERIAKITDSIRVTGAYNGQFAELGSILKNDNSLTPVMDWVGFAQKGGLEGQIDMLSIAEQVNALRVLYDVQRALKQDIYEITGLSDIIRGNTAPNETATAQQIKGQFATLRLSDRQQEVQRFARDIMRIKAEIIAEKFQPMTLALMSGIDPQDPNQQQAFMMALQLLRSDAMRTFRVDIETDSTVALDENAEKERRTEYLSSVGSFLRDALPLAQQLPPLLPFINQAILFASRGFKAGRELEAVLEQSLAGLEEMAQQTMNQPEQPDPAVMQAQQKAQFEQEKEAARQQLEVRKQDMNAMIAQRELDLKAQIETLKLERDAAIQREKIAAQALIEQQKEQNKAQMAAFQNFTQPLG